MCSALLERSLRWRDTQGPCCQKSSRGRFVEDVELMGSNRHFKGDLTGSRVPCQHHPFKCRIARGDPLIGGALGPPTLEWGIAGRSTLVTRVQQRHLQDQQHIVLV